MLTKDEYEKRFKENYRVEGAGLDMQIHAPCPFCGAPDFHVYRLDQLQEVTGKETVCKECGRGFRAHWQNDASTTTGGFVQTCGDDPPDYVPIPRATEKR
jgi:ribosomal protein S27AE